jgi:hypothetical protein
MKCLNPDCSEAVPDHLRYCVVCGADAKVPNVRAADRPAEVTALDQRLKAAEEDARIRGCLGNLNDFREAVAKSSAVVCRSLGVVNELVSSDNTLFATFYQGVHADARLPEDNEWDRIRQSVDSLLFPYYYDQMRFAALSIDGSGVTGYGEYCVVLKDAAIRDRASVFEENTILFVQHHRIVAGDPVPLGFRAIWANRDRLAAAKLEVQMTPSTKPDSYQTILVNSTIPDADFIEVNIYGPIHRRAVKQLSGPEPRRKADKAIFRSVLKKLREVGATWDGKS